MKLFVHDPEHLPPTPFKLEGSGKHMRHIELRSILPTRPLRKVLRLVAGRDRRVWRTLRFPSLRFYCFRNPLDVLLFSVIASASDVVVVSIGSNDGRRNDPLWAFRAWRQLHGVLVEPFPPAFARLERNYMPWRDRFALAQLAVGAHGGIRPFFTLADRSGPLDELGSLNRSLVEGHVLRLGLIGARIDALDVRCVTFPELCNEHALHRVDILLVDAEGQDGAILETAELSRRGVQLLVFEHSQLSSADRAASNKLLKEAGFEICAIGGNTAALRSTLAHGTGLAARAWSLVLNL